MRSSKVNVPSSLSRRTSPYAGPVVGLAKAILILSAQLPRLIHGYPMADPAVHGNHHKQHTAGSSNRHSPLNVFGDFPAKPVDEAGFWVYAGIAVFLVLAGGLFAGLTLGLMGQDEIYLQVIEASGDGNERIHARRVLKLLKKGKHWVLVTLLLSNVITNETLPIVLDRSLGGGWPAVVSSTVLIVIFGEIIPQSVCVRYGLAVGSYLSPFVLALMYLMYPIGKPTALLLDYILGEDHGTVYKKAGLKTLVTLHKTLGTSPAERLNQDEVTIISAVLDLKDKPVGSIMTPIKDVYTLSSEDILDEKTMDEILGAGYSRIPIHAPGESHNFVGMLLVKILITYDPEDCKRVGDFPLATLPETLPETSCLDIVNFFQEGKSHMVLVSSSPGENYGALGVVTLEDVIEELIGEEIIDESDVFIDVHKAIRRINPSPLARRGINAHYITRSVADTANNVSTVVGGGADIPPSAALDALGLENGDTTNESSRIQTTAEPSPLIPATEDAEARRHSLQIPPDMMAHLKHLGPSNNALNPKKTSSKTVKIKHGPQDESTLRGNMGRYRSNSSASVNNRPGSRGYGALPIGDGHVESGDTTADTHEQHYQISTQNLSGHEHDHGDHAPLITLESPRDYRPPPSQNRPKSSSAIDEHHTSTSPDIKRKVARSGSLVESIRTSGGVPKTVIETTSSEEDGEQEENAANGKENKKKGERSPLLRSWSEGEN